MSSELGDSLGFVSLVYLFVLIPWTLLYFHDFISERWYTIHDTRNSGVAHMCLTGLPMPFLVAYIILQKDLKEPDYKEMFAALAALVLSIYHLLRTIWGLIQLHLFKKWAIKTATAMESASYRCVLNASLNEPTSEGERLPFSEVLPTSTKFFEKLTWMNALKSSIKANASVQPEKPKRSNHKQPPFMFRRRGKDGLHASDGGVASESIYGDETEKEKRVRIARQISEMKVNNSIIDNEFLGSVAPPVSVSWKFQLHPHKPETTFVRWAVAYLAQFGKQWLQDSEAILYDKKSWESRRHSFASKVWGTAVLRMEVDGLNELRPVQGQDANNAGQNSLLSPERWRKLLPVKQDQLFDKHEILKSCFANGEGLPYNWPVLKKRSDPLPSHGLYRPLIKEAVAEMPSYLYDFVEDLDPYQMEWFAVFIGISKWCGYNPHLPISSPVRSSASDFSRPTPRQNLKPSDAPVRILQDQLGFDEPPTLSQCGFPFMKRGYGRYLWDNRGILQVSARIDNWLALSNGAQFEFLFENQSEPHLNNEIPETSNWRNDDANKDENNAEDKDEGNFCNSLKHSQHVFDAYRGLERRRLRYQLADYNTRHAHLEQGLTFMGCVVESVRSEIADFCYLEEDRDDGRWYPRVSPAAVEISTSNQLWSCLTNVARESASRELHFFDSAVQERLLWECQNGVHTALQHNQGEPYVEVQSRIEAMMLLLLGFPGIRIERSSDPAILKDNSMEHIFFYIRPVGGPQDLSIHVKMNQVRKSLYLTLVAENGSVVPDASYPIFRWQDWRDALEGHFMGKREWQVDHYMSFVSAHRTDKKISHGVTSIPIGSPEMGRKVLVWEGWWPFRAGMTFFELKQSSLIIVGDTMPSESSSGRDIKSRSSSGVRSTRFPPADVYYKASIPALSDASVFLDALLKLGPSVLGTRVPKGSPSRLGPLLPQKVPTPPRTPGSVRIPDTTESKNKKLGVGSMIYEDDIMQRKHPKLSPPPSPSESPVDSPGPSPAESPGPSPAESPAPSPAHSLSPDLFEKLNRFSEAGAMFVAAPRRSQEAPGYPGFETKKETEASDLNLLDRVKEQDPSAMHDLAKDLLTGTDEYRKNRTHALQLMERAIVLGHRIETVEMFVDTILDYGVNHGDVLNERADVDVARALKAIRMIWRDIDARHIVVTLEDRRNKTKTAKRIWNSTDNAKEMERMRRLASLHLKLVRMKRSGAMMRDLADNLSTWGKSAEELSAAIILYESAIMANCDLKAMNELALIYAPLDINFALKLYLRVEKLTEEAQSQARAAESDESVEASSGDFELVKRSIENRKEAGNTNAMILFKAIKDYMRQSCSEQQPGGRSAYIRDGDNLV